MTTVKSSKIILKGNVPDKFDKVPDSIYNYIELGLISANDLVVYLKLYNLFNVKHGYVYPTIDQLEISTKLARGTLNASLKNLVTMGLIKKEKGYNRNNIYIVYKPLEQAELYEQVPEMVELLQAKKIKKNIQAERDKQRLKHFKESIEEQEQEIRAVRIVPKLASNIDEPTAMTNSSEELEEITKNMSFEEWVRFTKEQNNCDSSC